MNFFVKRDLICKNKLLNIITKLYIITHYTHSIKLQKHAAPSIVCDPRDNLHIYDFHFSMIN